MHYLLNYYKQILMKLSTIILLRKTLEYQLNIELFKIAEKWSPTPHQPLRALAMN